MSRNIFKLILMRFKDTEKYFYWAKTKVNSALYYNFNVYIKFMLNNDHSLTVSGHSLDAFLLGSCNSLN